MSRGGKRLPAPRDCLIEEQDWPGGRLRKDAPYEALLVQGISERLRICLKDRSIVAIADMCGLSRSTVYNILNGNTWCDVPSIARLERVLDVELWGIEHRTRPDELTHIRATRRTARNKPWGRR